MIKRRKGRKKESESILKYNKKEKNKKNQICRVKRVLRKRRNAMELYGVHRYVPSSIPIVV